MRRETFVTTNYVSVYKFGVLGDCPHEYLQEFMPAMSRKRVLLFWGWVSSFYGQVHNMTGTCIFIESKSTKYISFIKGIDLLKFMKLIDHVNWPFMGDFRLPLWKKVLSSKCTHINNVGLHVRVVMLALCLLFMICQTSERGQIET